MQSPNRKWFFLILILVASGFWFLRATPEAARNSPPPAGPVVALGDSLTTGYGAPPGGGYVEMLSELIGRPIVNRGVNGDTAADGLARLDTDVLALKPGVVIVLLGGNDLLRKNSLDDLFDNSLRMIVERVQARGSMVVLVGLDGLPMSGVKARYAALAHETGAVYVPDILDGIFGNPRLMADGIHPNGDGHRLIAERIAEKMIPYLR